MKKHILYLASGNSRRFGENKLLYEFQGKPLFQHGLDMLWAYVQNHDDCTLTVVSRYEDIRKFAESYSAQVVSSHKSSPTAEKTNYFNTDYSDHTKRILAVDSPDSEKGISYTMKAGLNSLISDREINPEDFLLFVVADQPFLKEESLDRILALAKPGTETASMTHHGTPGNPGLFSASLIPELMELTGDQGGRKVMKHHDCIYVEYSSKEEFQDLDTKECMAKLTKTKKELF